MAVAGQVAVKFTADVAEYTKATEKVTRANKDVGKSAEGLLGDMKSLKKAMEQSGFNTLIETAKGGAVLAGVTFALDAIGNAGHGAAEAINEYKQGMISASAAGLKMAESVPILGRIATAAKGVAEAIDSLIHAPAISRPPIDPEVLKAEMRQFADTIQMYQQMRGAAEDYYITRDKYGFALDLAKTRADFAAATREVQKFKQEIANKEASKELRGPELAEAQFAGITKEKVALDKFADATKNTIANAVKDAATQSGGYLSGMFNGWIDQAKVFLERMNAEGKKARDIRDAILDKEKTITQAVIDRLAAQGALGNEEAKQAADRLRVEQQIKDKRAELQKVIEDPTTPDNLRRQAQDEMGRLPGVEDALKKALVDTPKLITGITPQLSAQFSTNVNDVPQKQLDEAKRANEILAKIEAAARDPFKMFSVFEIN